MVKRVRLIDVLESYQDLATIVVSAAVAFSGVLRDAAGRLHVRGEGGK